MNVIEINSSNFLQYLNLDIIAFSFANPGAQGEGGGIKIVTSDGALYHTNITNSITLEEIFLVCPPLKSCKFQLFNATIPQGWVSFYMGGGNFLVVQNRFKETVEKVIPNGLYNHWIDAFVSTEETKDLM